MPYVGKKPADIIATAVDTTTGTFSGEVDAASLDISGNIDVDGTTNLDIVDIDGAVDMASTLQVDGAITSSAGMTITTADNTDTLTLKSTDADANTGPTLFMQRDSASPADGDSIGKISFVGDNDAGETTRFARIDNQIADASNGTEDALMFITTMIGGTELSRMTLQPTEAVFNEENADIDFRVEGNGDANLFVVDAGEDNVKIGSSAGNYGILSIRNENAGAQERGLYVELAPASGTSPNNVAVFSATNSNMTQPLVRIHHENPTADQLLLQATTTGSNTVKFSVDEDGDIYSAGGINLGGTGSANYLDDYEEGTFTAEVRGASARASTPVTGQAHYTKVGNSVTVRMYFVNVNTTGASGTFQVTGFPFTATSLQIIPFMSFGQDYDDSGGVMNVQLYLEGGTTAQLIATKDNSAWQTTGITAGSGKYYVFTGTYLTA